MRSVLITDARSRERSRHDGSAVAVLRGATGAAHRRLERDLGLMSPGLTDARYRSLLVGFARLHQTLDGEIGVQLALAAPSEAIADLDFEARRRSPALARDLTRLGENAPVAVPFPLTSLAGALGALYVVEGATLGGSTIAPHVLEVLGPDTPVAFFRSYADEVPHMWSVCRRTINRLLVTEASTTEATAVAIAVFDCFAELLR
jgi:heme oxygenase